MRRNELDLERRNRAFLARFDPCLAAESARINSEPVHLEKARVAGWTARIGDSLLHDGEDPQGEARRLVSGPRHALHVHFGFGLGYYLDVDRAADEGLTLVYEPNPATIQAAMRCRDLTALLEGRNVKLCCCLDRFLFHLQKARCFGKSMRTVVNQATAALFPEQYQDFCGKVAAAQPRVAKTYSRLFPEILRATRESLPYTARTPGFGGWVNRAAGMPAVIVGAGPSLERNIADLAANKGKALIFAVSRVAKVLEMYGIDPDFLVHVEAQDYFQFIAHRHNLKYTNFLLADQAQSAYHSFPHGATYVFQSRTNPLTNCFTARFPDQAKEVVKTGGSVTTAAFYLAFRMGCNPLVLMGQDLAYASGRHYAETCRFDNGEPDRKEKRVSVPGYFGGMTVTNFNYQQNVVWYQRSLEVLKKMDPARVMINATEGGALLPGFQMLKFRDVAYRHLSGNVVRPTPEPRIFEPPAERALTEFERDLDTVLESTTMQRREFDWAVSSYLLQQSEGETPASPPCVVEAASDLLDLYNAHPDFKPLFKPELFLTQELVEQPAMDQPLRDMAVMTAVFEEMVPTLKALGSKPLSSDGHDL